MPGFPIAAIAQAAGPVITSLLQKKPKTYSPAQQIASTVKGAREAGIHPLAALGGGVPSYQTVGGNNMIGDAVGAGVSRIGEALDPINEAQLAQVKASTEAQLAQAELLRAQSRSLIAGSRAAATSGPPLWDSRKQETAAPMQIFGWDFVPRHNDPSAERAQEWYGEPGEWTQGISNLIRSNHGSLPTDDIDTKLLNTLRSWYVRNRGKSSPGPMP